MCNMAAVVVLISVTAALCQQATAKPLPKVPPNLDKKYRTAGDTREVLTYTRLADHVCTYPNDNFDCKNIAAQNTTMAVHQCGVCTWMPVGFGKANSGGVNFCAEDGSSYIKIHYGDRECQNYHAYPGEQWPNEEVQSAAASEPTCNISGKCSNQTPPVYCDLRDWNPGCDANPQPCDHNPPACTGGCCPPAGGAGSESLHVELAYWKIQEQKYVCGANGSCVPAEGGRGGLLADCQSACTKPSEGRYACTDGHCVSTAGSGISLAKCSTVCPYWSKTFDSLATLQI